MYQLSLRPAMRRPPLPRGLVLTTLALAGFAFAPIARALTPLPTAWWPDGNTAANVYALYSNTTGIDNTAIGDGALYSNTMGNSNTASGNGALYSNTTGGFNTATGYSALSNTSIGNFNTADGADALLSNTTGSNNTASGFETLYNNTGGERNTAIGTLALYANTTGSGNTASGRAALTSNTIGDYNSADGSYALYFNDTGNNNTANGYQALYHNTTGNNNLADGAGALANNIAGSNNIAVGISAGKNLTTGNNNIDIGNPGVAGENNTIRLGKITTQKKTYIAGISGATVAGGVSVVIDAKGRLGTVTSSAQFKDDIKPMDQASEALLALQPVTFRYKPALDAEGIPQFGLIAEQVEKVSPDLVARDAEGEVYTVRYEAVNAMLLNEFLKEHRRVEELTARVTQQQQAIETLSATLKEQATLLRKVSAQLDVNGRAPLRIVNNR